MLDDLGELAIQPKTGHETFHTGDESLGFDLASFWRWSESNLVSNATRGVLAEFIVAKAIRIETLVRSEWDPYDLETTDGIKIEVKSAAYLQSWHQDRLSSISFSVGKKRVWNSAANKYEDEIYRPVHVYVFALLAHRHKPTVDPMNVSQWQFYVLPTEVLNQRERSQHSITLNSLQKLTGGSVNYHQLKEAVARAAALPEP